MREIRSQAQAASAMSSHADRYADIAVRQLGAASGYHDGLTSNIKPGWGSSCGSAKIADAAAIAAIYNEGIADRIATFRD